MTQAAASVPTSPAGRGGHGALIGLAWRLAASLLVILGVVTAVFFLHRVLSDPIAPFVSPDMDQADIQALIVELGFDRPLPLQFLDFLQQVATGDFGRSRVYGQPVITVLAQAMPITVTIVMLTLLVAVVVGFVLGGLAAMNPGGRVDTVVMGLSMAGQAIPAFWFGILLILVFSVSLQWVPSGGYGTVEQLVLPVLALSANSGNQFARVIRAELIEALHQDHIRMARAKGLGRARVFLVHAMRNSLLPVVTLLGLQLSHLIAGTVVIEQVFSLPGVSRLLYTSILQGDYAVTQAIAIYAAVVVTVANLLVDLSYSVLDPKITFGGR